jgi:hypothetical protein
MAVSGRVGRCLMIAGLAGLAIGLVRQPVVAAGAPPMSLHLRVTHTQPLSAVSLTALMAEANAIWGGHIRLRWQTAGPPDTVPGLRVLLLARALPPSGEETPWALGELVRPTSAPPFAIASVTGAHRILDESGFDAITAPAWRDHRLGVVLGRAVAHEIGHYLLQTGTHATHGLMRARIDAREFADVRRESFRLDAAARAHLTRLAASGGTAQAFSYAR